MSAPTSAKKRRKPQQYHFICGAPGQILIYSYARHGATMYRQVYDAGERKLLSWTACSEVAARNVFDATDLRGFSVIEAWHQLPERMWCPVDGSYAQRFFDTTKQ